MKPLLGLYLHIPFCKSKCSYCDFYSLPRRETEMPRYTAALIAQLRAMAPRAQEYTVDTVYFGGGTPSYLGAERLGDILSAVKQNYSLAPEAEITLEANPDSITPAAAQTLFRAGFRRVSLGVQSADDAMLRRIGRIHSFAQAREAVGSLREAGFGNISLDLIYGLPQQTPAQWQDTLHAVLALQPEHLSCYGLTLEKGTPLYRRREEFAFPDEEEQAELYLYTVEQLSRQGYLHYEISNFARPGYSSRHNEKYWTGQEYLGFGPGAHSDFGGERFACARDLDLYLGGTVVWSERSRPDAKERLREYLMLALRTRRGIAARELEEKFSASFAPLLPALRRCQDSGYARETQGRWHLTPRGFLLSNQIITMLWEAMGL